MATTTAGQLTRQARALGLPDEAVECVTRENNVHHWNRAEPLAEHDYSPPPTHPLVMCSMCRRCGSYRYRGRTRWGTGTRFTYFWAEGYRELRASVIEDRADDETYGQAAARAYLLELGLVKPTTPTKMPAKRRERVKT